MPESPDTVRGLAQQITAGSKAPFGVRLRFGEYDLAVASNSELMIEQIRHTYRSFLDDAPSSRFAITIIDADAAPDFGLTFTRRLSEAAGDEAKDEFCDLPDGRVIRKRSNGILFASGDAIEIAIGPCSRHENKTTDFINSRYIQWLLHHGGLLAHAASVRGDTKGLVLSGVPGAGKTTMAFRLLDHDLRLVGKDRVVLRREADGLRMYGAPKPPRVNSGTAMTIPKLRPVLKAAYAQKLEKLSSEELWSVEKKHDVFIEELYGPASTCLDGPVDHIVLLNWRRGAGPVRIERVDPGERRDLLRILMQKRGIFYRSQAGSVDPEPDEAAYLALLADCPMYEIGGGIDFEQATEFCAGLLA